MKGRVLASCAVVSQSLVGSMEVFDLPFQLSILVTFMKKSADAFDKTFSAGSEPEPDIEYEVEEVWDGKQWRMVHRIAQKGLGKVHTKFHCNICNAIAAVLTDCLFLLLALIHVYMHSCLSSHHKF